MPPEPGMPVIVKMAVRLDEIYRETRRIKNELETGTIRKRETSGKSEKIQAVVTDSKTRKELYQEYGL